MAAPQRLEFTGEREADELLARDPLALLIGMLLDQQFPMERAFLGPFLLQERLGRPLEAADLAALDPGELEATFKGPPALHRYPGSMATRTQQLCRYLVDEHGGDAEAVWREAADGRDLLARLRALPGFGEAKARIFLAVLGKRLGVAPSGWREAAGDYGEDGVFRSVADVARFEDLEKVRHTKQLAKAAQRGG